MIEDFTHVLPEDKAPNVPTKSKFAGQVFDLGEVNKKAAYYRDLREKMEATADMAKQSVRLKHKLDG